MALDFRGVTGLFGKADSLSELQVTDIAGTPSEQHKEGTIILNTKENRLYVRTVGAEDLPTLLFYNLNQTSGTTVVDLSTGGNNGTASSAGSWTTDGYFDGGYDTTTDNVITIGSMTWDANAAFTIEMWVKFSAKAANNLLLFRIAATGTDNIELRVNSDGNAIDFERHDVATTATFVTSTTALQLGVWYHIGCVYDGTNLRIYINGVLEDEAASSETLTFVDGDDVFIGAANSSGGASPDAVFDEVKMWSSARTSIQIANDSLEKSGLTWSYVQLIGA